MVQLKKRYQYFKIQKEKRLEVQDHLNKIILTMIWNHVYVTEM